MKESCENEYCENPGVKVVPVSVDRCGGQVRTLCAACEEAYTRGVQHGQLTAGFDRLGAFLRRGGFVVLAMNREDGSPGAPFEAWAYEGPLDFGAATPVVFGLGEDCRRALEALNGRLPTGNDGPRRPGRRTP